MEKMKKSFSTKIVSDHKPTKKNEEIKSNIDMKMSKSVSYHKTVLLHKSMKHSGENKRCERFLISINVLGSAGSIRFVVNGDDSGAVVIERALKIYAREGRLPILGYHVNNFVLYSANEGFEAFKISDAIGLNGVRNFILCKNQTKPQMTEARAQAIDRKWSGWRVWLQKSLSLKMIAH